MRAPRLLWRAPLPAPMRTAAALTLVGLLLAGCTTPDEPEADLWGLCPMWEEGGEASTGRASLDAAEPSAGLLFGDETRFTHQNRSLDVVRVVVERLEATGGRLELRAFHVEKEERRPIRDYRFEDTPQMVPVVTWGPDENATDTEYDVHLTAVDAKAAPAPGQVRLEWRLQGDGEASAVVDISVHYLYRVCGAPA